MKNTTPRGSRLPAVLLTIAGGAAIAATAVLVSHPSITTRNLWIVSMLSVVTAAWRPLRVGHRINTAAPMTRWARSTLSLVAAAALALALVDGTNGFLGIAAGLAAPMTLTSAGLLLNGMLALLPRSVTRAKATAMLTVTLTLAVTGLVMDLGQPTPDWTAKAVVAALSFAVLAVDVLDIAAECGRLGPQDDIGQWLRTERALERERSAHRAADRTVARAHAHESARRARNIAARRAVLRDLRP